MRELLLAKFIPNTKALVLLEKRWRELGPNVSKLEYSAIYNSVRYLRLMLKCTLDKVEELDKFLQELGLEEEIRVVIENICPTNKDLLRLILAMKRDSPVTLTEEEMDEIINKIKELLG